jgi:hypothetical protein
MKYLPEIPDLDFTYTNLLVARSHYMQVLLSLVPVGKVNTRKPGRLIELPAVQSTVKYLNLMLSKVICK